MAQIKKFFNLSLSSQILIGVVLGCCCGIFWGEKVAFISFAGDLFIKLLQITVLPYIVVSLTGSLAKLTYGEAAIMAKRVSLLMVTVWVITLAFVVCSPFTFPHIESASFFSDSMIPDNPHPDYLKMYIPYNPFASLAQDAVPAVVLFCIMTGVALIGIKKKEVVVEPMDLIAMAMSRITSAMIKLSPVGLFAITASAAGTLYVDDLLQMQVYIWLYIVLSLFFTFWVLPGIVTTFTSIPYRVVFSTFSDALITSFFTGNLFVVLPMIIEEGRALLKEYVGDNRELGNAVDVLVPASFNFPNAGKLLLMLFIPFAAWISNVSLSFSDYWRMLGVGFFTFFGSVNLAIPSMLNFFRIPYDTFNLFIMSGVITSRFSTIVAAMFTVVIALAGPCMMTGRMKFSFVKVTRYLLLTSMLGILMFSLIFLFFRHVVKIEYNKDDLALSMKLITPSPKEVRIYRHVLPPLKQAPANVPLIQDIKNRGFIRVGYNENSKPFTFFNSEGKLVGFDIDMAYQLALDLDVNLELVPCAFEDVVRSLREGRFDTFMSRYLVTPERAVRVNFSNYYIEGTAAFFVPDYKADQFTKYSELVDRRLKIGIAGIPYYTKTAVRLFPKSEFVILDSLDTYLDDRKKQEVDAILTTAEGGSFMSLLYPGFSVVIPEGLEDFKIPMAYPVRMNGSSFMRFLNTWIELKKKDGTIDRFYDHWILGRDVEQKEPRWCIARDVLHWID